MRRLRPSRLSTDPQLSLGRSEYNDIVLADDSISRTHLLVARLRSGRYLITDALTTNGTFLTDARGAHLIHQAVVDPTTALRCGQVSFRLEEVLPTASKRKPETGTPV